MLIDQGTTPTQAAKMIGVSCATVYRALQREATDNYRVIGERNRVARYDCRYSV
jgi:transposase